MTARPQSGRRAFLASGAAAMAAPFSLAATAQAACGVAPEPVKARPQKAISLSQLSEALAAGKPVRLEGFTRLDGYVIDDENKDLVIYGISEPGQPELQAPDLVVALRAEFKRGSGVDARNVADYTKPPAISLDPNPDVMKRLATINTASPEGRRQYSDVCSSAQTVRVDGFERHTRVAKILIDADYKMKKVSAGLETLPIASPFSGDFDMIIKDWRAALASGQIPQIPQFMTRYWFTPGKFTHGVAKDNQNMVRFGYTQVTLKDEVDVYSHEKKLTASGQTNQYARAFTCNWTDRMEDTYKAEPLWQEMRNMFRWFALARVMRDLDAFRQAGMDPSFLLDRYQVPRVQMPATLPGVARMEVGDRTDANKTKWVHSQTVCGGVEIGFNNPLPNEGDPTGLVMAACRAVLGARPSPAMLAWNIARAMLFSPQ